MARDVGLTHCPSLHRAAPLSPRPARRWQALPVKSPPWGPLWGGAHHPGVSRGPRKGLPPTKPAVSHPWLHIVSSPAFGHPIPDLTVALGHWDCMGSHRDPWSSGLWRRPRVGHSGPPGEANTGDEGAEGGAGGGPSTLRFCSGSSRAHGGPDVWAELVRPQGMSLTLLGARVWGL